MSNEKSQAAPLKPEELVAAIQEYTREAYPEMQVRVEDVPDERPSRHIYFTESMFTTLYPLQRFNYLVHLFPADFYEAHLEDTQWYELAPGEAPEDLVYPEDGQLALIAEPTLEMLSKTGFFELVDDEFSPIDADTAPAECFGDFRHAQRIFARLEYTEQERWDAAHILMHEGAYCDCDILFTLCPESRTALRKASTHGDDHIHDHAHEHEHDHDGDHDHAH